MSDFLSKFNKDKYHELMNEQEDKKNDQARNEEARTQLKQKEQSSTAQKKGKQINHDATLKSDRLASRSTYRQDVEEEVEIDPDYRRKKKRRMWVVIAGSLIACIAIFFIYYMLVHVKVENFVDTPVSEARTWAKENGVEVGLEQEYTMEYEANRVVSQSVDAGDRIRKGKTLELVSSLGPDPEAVIPLPDFSEMSQDETENWIDENKAENVQIVTEYSDDIDEGEFIKVTIKDSEIEASEYKRKDSAAVYYSKGEEVFEKNITIPDFTGTAKEEVEKWAETNEIKVKYKEADSDSVEAGNIISQNKDADDKIAKRSKMEVVVSVGKAIVVPSFGELTPEEAASHDPDLDVLVKQAFNAEVAYGKIISQSVEAGTKITEKDDKSITVVYSQGKPYLQDFRGQTEGDLPELFYEEYQSKGADINYIIKYVDSPEVKGTVVYMSKFNEFIPLTYTVEIHISNNTSALPHPDESVSEESEEPPEEGEVEEPEEDQD